MGFDEIRSHLSKFTVGIAGAGGLGSNCAVALARTGVGTIILCDYDKVETANLNRQYYFTGQVGMFKVTALKENIYRISSEIKIVPHIVKLTKKNIPVLFKDCSIVVEALDRADEKEMLLNTLQTKMSTIVIGASGVAGWGKSDKLKCRKIDNSLYICGDEATEVTDDCPALAPRIGIVANMQANLVIAILMNMYEDQT